MAISFPRALPLHGYRSLRFEVQRVDYLAPEAGGRLGGVTAGEPLWTLSADLAGVNRAQSDEWRAWVASLRGSQFPFIGRDVFRPGPRAYWKTGFPPGFTGQATAWAQTLQSNGSVTLALAVPSGITVAPGDYCDFRWVTAGAERRSLVRFLEAATSVAGALSAAIEPAVPLVTPPTAVAHLDLPGCIMRLTPETSIGPREGSAYVPTRLAAVQDLRP